MALAMTVTADAIVPTTLANPIAAAITAIADVIALKVAVTTVTVIAIIVTTEVAQIAKSNKALL